VSTQSILADCKYNHHRMDRISSRQNPIVKRFRELARTADPALVLLDGEHLLEEAIKSDVAVETVALADGLGAERIDAIGARALGTGARLILVGDEVMTAMSPVRQPSGIVAIAKRRAATIDEALDSAPQMALILADVQDPGNVGAIVRVAEACGATGVITSEGTADPFGWKALRGSMGSAFRMPIAARVDLATAIREAQRKGTRVIAAVPRGGTPLPDAEFHAPVTALLGGEGGGLRPDIVALVDERVTIPMTPSVESLNVATAAALIVYEAWRQRQSAVPRS
jgi:RNA methyltransferase, TrmH family